MTRPHGPSAIQLELCTSTPAEWLRSTASTGPGDDLRVVIGHHNHLLTAREVVPAIAFVTGTKARSRSSRPLRLRSPEGPFLPSLQGIPLTPICPSALDQSPRALFVEPCSPDMARRRTHWLAAPRADVVCQAEGRGWLVTA